MIDPERLRSTYVEHVAELERAYAQLLGEHALDAVVIHSGAPKPRTAFDDQYWPLRPTPHFQHWLPLPEADCALVIRPGVRPRLVWPRAVDFWEHPPRVDSSHWQDRFEIVEVDRAADVRPHLPSGRVAFVGENRSRAEAWGLSHALDPALLRALDALRTRKSAYEVLCLEEANRRAALGHRRVAEAFASGESGELSELELHLLYLGATGQDDPETPYKNIVARGANAATLHHVSYERQAAALPCDSLLLDAGAAYLGYCSDVTRTYVKGAGAAASLFAALIERTEGLQQRLCAEARIGLPYEALHDRSHQEIAQVLSDLKLVRMSPEEILSTGISRTFFPHGLGHSLGLQCHDVGCAELKPRADNPFLRNTSVIAADQVFTIEPGIYFIEVLLGPLRQGPQGGQVDWALLDALKPLGGIRIEDDLHVIEGEPARNLTRAHLG